MIKIYGNKRYAFISLTGLLLWFFSFSLQSCSSIGGNKLNINPITRQQLQQQGSPLHLELNAKIQELENEGFIGGVDPNNDDVRKHLMFVFCHSLDHRQNNMNLQQRIAFFQGNADAQNLVWEFGIIGITHPRTRIQRFVLEFRLKNLFNQGAPVGNSDNARQGTSPLVRYNDYKLNRLNVVESVEIDHILKDNDVVIELPETLHQLKTLLIDNLINPPGARIIRDSASHWRRRVR